jgi:hypothetical protein
MFDAANGIDRRYEPLFVQAAAPDGASPEAAVVAAAYTTLIGLFPSRQAPALDPAYCALDRRASASAARPAATRTPSCETRIQDGIDWGADVAHAILAMRANDGFSGSYPAFVGGQAIGQWRPTPPAFGPMSAPEPGFTDMFVLASNRPSSSRSGRGRLPARSSASDFNVVKALGRRTGSTAPTDQTALAPVLGWQRQRPLEPGGNQMAERRHLSLRERAAVRGLEHRDGRYRP